MLLILSDILSPAEVMAAAEALSERAVFEDGTRTAGWHAREVKRNLQARAGGPAQAVVEKVRAALVRHEVFVAAARPKRFARVLASRYEPGMAYGTHVDDAIIGGARTDLSFTLFLSRPDSYEGGELVIEDSFEDRSVKLPAGQMILYPSSTLHRVEPVTRGVRLAVVGWVHSLVRDPAEREILFDLETTLRSLHATAGKSADFDRLVKVRTNLLRRWAEM